jgi:hypothetical protein
MFITIINHQISITSITIQVTIINHQPYKLHTSLGFIPAFSQKEPAPEPSEFWDKAPTAGEATKPEFHGKNHRNQLGRTGFTI